MAIQKLYNFQGIELPDAYWVVNSIDYRKGLKQKDGMGALGFGAGTYNAQIIVYIFKDKEARDTNMLPIAEESIYFNISSAEDAKSPVAQAYDYINKLQDYKDGEAV